MGLLDVLAGIGVEGDRAVGETAAGGGPDRFRGGGVVAGDLGQPGAEIGQRVVASLRHRDHALGVAGGPDQVLERFAVAIEEGFPLRLAVIGEDDEAVGTGRLASRRRDPGDLAVEVAEDGEGVVAFDPRVVGDLVVGEERRVDHRPPGEDVADHGCDLEVALDDRPPGPDQGVGTRPRRSAAGRRRAPGCVRRGARARCRPAPGRRCGRPRRAGRSRRSSRARSAVGGSARCSSSASSAARRRRGCWRGWRRRRGEVPSRRNGGARAVRRRGGDW